MREAEEYTDIVSEPRVEGSGVRQHELEGEGAVLTCGFSLQEASPIPSRDIVAVPMHIGNRDCERRRAISEC
jgi:hypothetical protein